MSMIQAIHSASASYFEVIIIWIIVERVLFISRVGKRRNISAKAKAIICCTVVIGFHLFLIVLSFSNIVIGVRITYFMLVMNLVCFAGFLLLNKLYRQYFERARSADLNTRYEVAQSIRISKTMIYLSLYSLIPFSVATGYMLMASYYWRPNNLLNDFAIASNFIDLQFAVFGLLYPLVFVITHPEVNAKFFNLFLKRKNNVHPTTRPDLKTTLGGKNLIIDNNQEGQLYFEQLKNQWN